MSGALGQTLATPSFGYSLVYHLEIGLLFATLVALGPLVRLAFQRPDPRPDGKLALADFPT
jgi:BCD family chlorophyll transporter-like MFS transporter